MKEARGGSCELCGGEKGKEIAQTKKHMRGKEAMKGEEKNSKQRQGQNTIE